MGNLLALDLFCGGGGAALGMMAAGFHVVGVDRVRRHSKVYPGEFICGDALAPPVDLADFDLVWASPPCQAFSSATAAAVGSRAKAMRIYPDLIEPVRTLLAGHACTVMENVPLAPIRCDLVLTGPMVGLGRIVRRRHFEMSWWPGLQPQPITLPRKDWIEGRAVTITKSMAAWSHYYPRKAAGLPGRVPVAEAREVMGITTPMTGRQVGEAVPPPYSEYVARLALSDPCGPLADLA